MQEVRYTRETGSAGYHGADVLLLHSALQLAAFLPAHVVHVMENYKILDHLTSGAHGLILEAVSRRDRTINNSHSDSRRLAIKRILIQSSDLPLSVAREIECLRMLKDQQFIVQLLDVCKSANTVNLVFPLLPSNLTHLIHELEMDDYQKKCMIFMMSEGVRVLHSFNLMHRDLKPSNMLIDWNGCLKICDFGQSRSLSPDSLYSHQVSTRSYRSPELLYGATKYGQEVDMWSMGCIIAEMYIKKILFTRHSDISQLSVVISCLGLVHADWGSSFPDYGKITFDFDEEFLKQNRKDFRSNIRDHVNDERISDIIFSLVRYTNRETAEDIVRNPIFQEFREQGINFDLLIKPVNICQPVGPVVS